MTDTTARRTRRRLALLAAIIAAACLTSTVAQAAPQASPPRFMDRITFVTGEHPTSGLSGFPARDYGGPGGEIFRAPFNGCVPTVDKRPWGWAATQDPARGFGGMRIYLRNSANGLQVYAAHAGFLYVRPGECFKQGDPIGKLWDWPGDPGRSHSHLGYQGGDPLVTLIRRDGTFVLETSVARAEFPMPRLILEDTRWVVRVGAKVVYAGGRDQATVVYKRQKLARTINLHFRDRYPGSPLVGYGLTLVRVNQTHGVDPRLPTAIASCETSGGTRGDGPQVNNDFGLLTPGGAHREFRDRDAAIRYLAGLLETRYLADGLTTIPSIGGRYAPVGASNDNGKNRSWVPCVTRQYERVHGTKYLPRPIPVLRKVDVVAAEGDATVEGRWQCYQERAGVLYQSTYAPARDFCADKIAYWERQAA